MSAFVQRNVRTPRAADNDNAPYAACIEVHDAVKGWKIHVDYQGKNLVLDPRVAGTVAWELFQNRPHLRSAACDIYESVKRVRLLEGGVA